MTKEQKQKIKEKKNSSMLRRPPKIVRYGISYLDEEGFPNFRIVTAATPVIALETIMIKYKAMDVMRLRKIFNPIIDEINKDNGYHTNEEESEPIYFTKNLSSERSS